MSQHWQQQLLKYEVRFERFCVLCRELTKTMLDVTFVQIPTSSCKGECHGCAFPSEIRYPYYKS